MLLGKDGFSEYRRQKFSAPIEANQLRIGGVKLSYMKPPETQPSQQELNEMVDDIHESDYKPSSMPLKGDDRGCL